MNTSNFLVFGVVAFYMTAALVMVFVNKAVLNSAPDLPLLFLLVQLAIAVILLQCSALITPRISIPKLELETAKKLTPVVLVNAVGLVFNMFCLKGVEASFFQIARGLVLPLTIMVSMIHTHSRPSRSVLFGATIVTLGFFVGIAPSSNLPVSSTPSLVSLTYGVLSSLFIAFHAVLIKSSLQYCNNSTIELAYWSNLGSSLFLVPLLFLSGELGIFKAHLREATWDFGIFVSGCAITGVFGFLLCIAGLLSIKVTSPITHMFSSAARSVIQTLLGVWMFGDILNLNRAMSIAVILGGTMYYTWTKSYETSNALPPKRSIDIESLRKAGKSEDHRASELTTEKDATESK